MISLQISSLIMPFVKQCEILSYTAIVACRRISLPHNRIRAFLIYKLCDININTCHTNTSITRYAISLYTRNVFTYKCNSRIRLRFVYLHNNALRSSVSTEIMAFELRKAQILQSLLTNKFFIFLIFFEILKNIFDKLTI